MSSLPGYSLESYVAWNYDLIVEDQPEANVSLGLAEAIGTIPRREIVSKSKFAEIIARFESYREQVEDWLSCFDEENQSWRTYSAGTPVPDDVF